MLLYYDGYKEGVVVFLWCVLNLELIYSDAAYSALSIDKLFAMLCLSSVLHASSI